MTTEYLLSMQGITKEFPGVVALNNVDFNLKKGELHALVGENGAGKSTLMKVLGGVYIPEAGTITLNGEAVSITNPRDALDLKISTIYQEFNLVDELTVWENIFLGKELHQTAGITMNKKTMRKQSKEIIEKLGLEGLNVNRRVGSLSVAQKQLVEIGKALFNETSILVMDEPTAVLTQRETQVLFDLIDGLLEEGISIVYISHRLEELIGISDRITVLRDGEYIDTLDNSSKDVSTLEIVRLMVGRSLQEFFHEREANIQDDIMLEVNGLTKKGVFEDVSFKLRKGEILGLAGLVGAGRTEIAKAIFGDLPFESGEILLDGKKVSIKSTHDAIDAGIALVPEDRAKEGLVLLMTLSDNIALPNLDTVSTLGSPVKRKMATLTNDFIEKLTIRPGIPNRQIKSFSGGNQQKAVLSKWLARNPKVIILDEPTRGIDIGAKSEIYTIIQGLSEQGTSILFISSELTELLANCDRIIAIHEGQITGEFDKCDATQENVMQACAGVLDCQVENVSTLARHLLD